MIASIILAIFLLLVYYVNDDTLVNVSLKFIPKGDYIMRTKFNLENVADRNELIREVNSLIPNKKVFLICPACLMYTFENCVNALMFVFHHAKNQDTEDKFLDAHLFNIGSADFGVYIKTTYGTYILKTLDSYSYELRHNVSSGEIDKPEFGYDPFSNSVMPKDMAKKRLREFIGKILKAAEEKQQKNSAKNIVYHILLNKLMTKYLDRHFDSWTSWHLKENIIGPGEIEYNVIVRYDSPNGKITYCDIKL